MNAPQKPRPQGHRKLVAPSSSSQELNKESTRPPVRHGYVKSFDGTRLFFSVEGKGKPLVFCYGLVCSSLHWTYQIQHFSKSHQAIWFDYRGHQNSDTPEDLTTLTIENSAKDLHFVLNELDVSKAVLLGHSMGVNVVLEYYRQHPERVEGLVLANGTPQPPLETLFGHNAFRTGFSLLSQAYRRSPTLLRKLWTSQKDNPLLKSIVALGGFNPHLTSKQDIELYIEQVMKTDPGIFIHLIENYEKFDARSWLHTIDVPTLILAGENDHLTPLSQQKLMNQLIQESTLEVIGHGSHCPQMDLPELVNAKIEKFLERT